MTAEIVSATALSHVALRVREVARSIAWYREVLGYEVLTDGPAPTPDRTRSAMGLICQGRVALELLEAPGGRPTDSHTLGVAGLSITVPDIVVAVAAYNASSSGQGAAAIDAGDWRVAFLFDPDGNVVELVQQPEGLSSIADFADTLRRRRDEASASEAAEARHVPGASGQEIGSD